MPIAVAEEASYTKAQDQSESTVIGKRPPGNLLEPSIQPV
jgi:hypothetical protein